nr:immunoglobulin light chain junction region [Macaca mulatta]
CQKYTASPLTF